MKPLKSFFFFLLWSFFLLSCSKNMPEDIDDNSENNTEVNVGDTIEYRALVFVEESDMERYGGERVFKNSLDKMFHNTTRFWNESTNKFKYYFRWVPAGIQTYKIEGKGKNDVVDKSKYDEFRKLAEAQIDTKKYDFTVFFALSLKPGQGGLSCGGTGSGHKVVWAYIEKTLNIFTDANYPDKGTYSNLGHEYGHVRGAQDLYQYMIPAERNKISGQAYDYPKCNMGTGYREWSDYCSSLFNYDAKMKQLPDRFNEEIFPKKVVIRVKKDGEPVSRASVKIWGTRAGGYFGGPEVYAKEPFLNNKKTDNKGELTLTKIYEMYNRPTEIEGGKTPPKTPKDEFPFSRWYCFLVEAESGGKKGYGWLSDLDIVPKYLDTGEETYLLEIILE